MGSCAAGSRAGTGPQEWHSLAGQNRVDNVTHRGANNAIQESPLVSLSTRCNWHALRVFLFGDYDLHSRSRPAELPSRGARRCGPLLLDTSCNKIESSVRECHSLVCSNVRARYRISVSGYLGAEWISGSQCAAGMFSPINHCSLIDMLRRLPPLGNRDAGGDGRGADPPRAAPPARPQGATPRAGARHARQLFGYVRLARVVATACSFLSVAGSIRRYRLRACLGSVTCSAATSPAAIQRRTTFLLTP